MSSRPEGALLGYLSLFGSAGTLVCCALPSLLVLLGLGATVASLLSAVPWLVVLSRHKAWIFTLSGTLIAANFLYVFRPAHFLRVQEASCRTDGLACARASRFARAMLWLSAALFLTGFSVAYVVGPILLRFTG